MKPCEKSRLAYRPGDLDQLIDSKAEGVVLSAVSMATGFQEDLKAASDPAHSRQAIVYAHGVQAVGAVPVDVRESGIDFLACSSFTSG